MGQSNYNQQIVQSQVIKEKKRIGMIFKLLIFLMVLLIILPGKEAIRLGILYKTKVVNEFFVVTQLFDTREISTLNIKNVKSKIFSIYESYFKLAQIKEKDNNIIMRFIKDDSWSFSGGKIILDFPYRDQALSICYITVTTIDGKVLLKENLDTSENLVSLTINKKLIEDYSKINITISNSKVIQYKLRFIPWE